MQVFVSMFKSMPGESTIWIGLQPTKTPALLRKHQLKSLITLM